MTRGHRKSKESRVKEKKKNQKKECTKALHNILSKHQRNQINGRFTNKNIR